MEKGLTYEKATPDIKHKMRCKFNHEYLVNTSMHQLQRATQLLKVQFQMVLLVLLEATN